MTEKIELYEGLTLGIIGALMGIAAVGFAFDVPELAIAASMIAAAAVGYALFVIGRKL